MKRILILVGLLVAACSEPRHEVSVEVETERDAVGPVARTSSVETKVEVDEAQAAEVREALRE